jgi:hypothetical protein
MSALRASCSRRWWVLILIKPCRSCRMDALEPKLWQSNSYEPGLTITSLILMALSLLSLERSEQARASFNREGTSSTEKKPSVSTSSLASTTDNAWPIMYDESPVASWLGRSCFVSHNFRRQLASTSAREFCSWADNLLAAEMSSRWFGSAPLHCHKCQVVTIQALHRCFMGREW